MSKPIVYVDMDGVLCDYHTAHKQQKSDKNPYPQSRYGFFRNLKTIKDSMWGYSYLNEYFDVYILTSPSILNPSSYTEKREWVEKYLGLDICSKLILSPNKALLKGDYLIDDNIHDGFEGEHLHFGATINSDWAAIIQYFINKGLIPKNR